MRRTARLSSLSLLLSLAAPALAQDVAVPRQVVAPAEDVLTGVVALPDPEATATRTACAVLRPELVRGADGRWRGELALEVSGGPLTLLTISTRSLRAELVDGRGGVHDVRRAAVEGSLEPLDGWFLGRLGERRVLAGVAAGTARLSLVTDDPGPDPGPVLVLVGDANRARGEAWVDGPLRTAEQPLPLAARAVDGLALRARFEYDAGRAADGRRVVELFDDGLHDDGAPLDGRFGGALPAGGAGDVVGRVVLEGRSPDGPFRRDVPLAFPLHGAGPRWTGAVAARVTGPREWTLDLGVEGARPTDRVQVGAEVWGRDALGREVPVGWLGRLVRPRAEGAQQVLSMTLDGGLLERAGARPPLVLRAVRLVHPDTHGVLDLRAELPVAVRALPPGLGAPVLTLAPAIPTGGGFDPAGPPSPAPPPSSNPVLLLVHGYCSGGTPWPTGDFSGPLQTFFDPNQNRSHDQFAQLLVQQAAAAGRTSFGVVGHSQGGPAALHLRTYYQSPLDQASGGRRIQSLASPYQGTPLASLGSFACGVNNDMTPAGSATWLAGIPSWARDEVWYWTVSDGGSACNFFSGLLLSNPEDGTVEVARGQLPGAHSMGNTTGWCHTTGMTYPAGYQDAARNAALDAAAAR